MDIGFECMFVLIGLCLPFSHSSHSMPPEAAEAGADQRLPADGGRVHQKSGADEASGRKTGGQLSATCASSSFKFGFNSHAAVA